VNLPFTVDQFFAVFAEYNQSFWPIALVLWVASAALLAAAWSAPAAWSRALSTLLAMQWLWSGVAYHALLFTNINPAAWLFAALFVIQGGLLVWRSREVRFFSTPGARNAIGMALSSYALAYPLLTVVMHGYPATPTFGVPCPTAILTVGALLTARRPFALAAIPVLWGFIGGSAALLFAVWPDYVLLGAGVLLVLALVSDGLGNVRRVH
jgi:hypothetical protein